MSLLEALRSSSRKWAAWCAFASLGVSFQAPADENFIAGNYVNPSNGAKYIVAGAPTGTGRMLWTMTSAYNTSLYFHAAWETGPAVGNTLLAGMSAVATYPGGYGGGRSYGMAGMSSAGWAGSTVAASQAGTTLTISRLFSDGATSSSFNINLVSRAASGTSATSQFRPGIYRSYNGFGYLVSGAPSQSGRTIWTVVSLPDNPHQFNAAWESGPAIGNTMLASAWPITTYPAGYGAGRSYGAIGQNSIGWSAGSALSAAQVDGTLHLANLYSSGETATHFVLVRERSYAGSLSAGSQVFSDGYYRSAAGVRYLVTGGDSGGGRTMWTIGSVSSPTTFNASWQSGAATGNVLLAGSAWLTSYPGGYLGGRSYGVVGSSSFGWSSSRNLAAVQAGTTILLSLIFSDGTIDNQFVIVRESDAPGSLGGGTESYTGGSDYQDVYGNNYTVSGSGGSWAITATTGVTLSANWVTGPVGTNPLYTGNTFPVTYPAGYAAGRSYGLIGGNSLGWSSGGSAAFMQVGNAIMISTLYTDGTTSAGRRVVKGGTGGTGGVGAVAFDASTYYVNKWDASATISVARFDGGTGASSITYSTSDGSGVSGTDYVAAAGAVLSWVNGDSSRKTLSIAIPATARPGKSFTVNLSNPVGTSVGARSSATIVIVDSVLDLVSPFGSPRALADFDADGKGDLVWRTAAPGSGLSWWLMNANALGSSNYHEVNSEWQIADVGDLDGDGRSDLIWRRASDGAAYLWTLDGFSFKGFFDLGILPPTTWTLVGVGDLDGDGKGDILWRNVDGTLYGWLMNGGAISSQGVIGNPGATWQVMDIADMDGDGSADIVFRNSVSGQVYSWFMNGLAIVRGGGTGALDVGQWSLLAAADFDGDGKADLLWRGASGDTWVWLMNGAAIVSAASLGNPGVSWFVAGLADFNSDGKVDLVWRHTDGTTYLWTMNGTAVMSYLPIANPGGTWQIVAP